MTFQGIQWWSMPLWGGKEGGDRVNKLSSKGSSSKFSCEYGYGFGVRDSKESVKFPLKGAKLGPSSSSSSRKMKKKWQSREERKIDRENGGVLVPKDGVCLSGSEESEDSDWSIGWLEPHGPDFLTDDEIDDSFAVLVPCYKNDKRGPAELPNTHFLNAINHLTDGKNLIKQWMPSLQHF